MVNIENLDLDAYVNAIKTLESAIKKDRLSDLERDGAIQRFEYTFELAWKMIRKVLIAMGRSEVSASPKPIIRDAAEEGLINDVNPWFKFLEARNLSTHIYNENEAKKVFDAAKEFLPFAKELLKNINAFKSNEIKKK